MIKIQQRFEKIKISSIFDFIFFNVALFLILFAWSNFILKKRIIALIVSLSLLVAINIARIIYKSFFGTKKTKNVGKNKNYDLYMLCLITNSKKENFELFSKILKDKKPIKTRLSNFMMFESDKTSAISFDFESQLLKQENALKLILFAIKNKIEKLSILCCGCSSKDKLFFENIKEIKVKVFEKNQICSLFFEKSQIFPKKLFEVKNIEKIKFKSLIKISLDRKKSKSYFISGLLIFLCSLIVRYNIYYVIMSSIMFFLSIMCKQNKKEATNDLF